MLMSKIVLLVVIVYNNAPTVTYRGTASSIDDCYSQAMMLARNAPPEGDTITKYLIGCSYEQPTPAEPS